MIDSTIAAVIEDGLVLTLEIVPETRNALKGHRITLILKNNGAENLFLQFPPNQGVEFLVYERGAVSGSAPARRFLLLPPIANALNSGLLRNGQPISFAVFWDGKNEQGVPLQDAATIAGRLLSRPGGAPQLQTILLEK
jgi:hypothetical protein